MITKVKISVIKKIKNEKNRNEFMKANLRLLFLLYKYEKRNKNEIGMIKINLIISLIF